ncbi:MAG: hypothetical protein HYW24_02375 [Candidatus Aenigmarchaeota archaeon]|nr:hypothetical protein [Candidatus Aenigmarchaeota archaeon]
MNDVVLWKPLYYTSIAMFVLSLVLFPFSSQWSIIVILALVTLWSRIPGFVHFIFNKLALNDLFTLIIAVHAGPLVGGLFGVFGIMFARIFGPNEWLPYSIRASVAVFVAGISVPLITSFTGGLDVTALYAFEGVLYFTYYALVLLFWKEEIGLEIALLPAVIFFDFFMNAFLISVFGETLSNMMTIGLSSGWPFLIFSGVILAYVMLARNGKRIAGLLERLWSKFGSGEKKERDENLAYRIGI